MQRPVRMGIIRIRELGLGHIANSEIALYKRLGFDYFYLGESSDYKAKLDGYEISNFLIHGKLHSKPTTKKVWVKKNI